MKNLAKTKWFIFGTYLLLVLTVLLLGYLILQSNKALKNGLVSFFEVAENKSFDFRQQTKNEINPAIPSRNIVVLAVDDASLELLWEKYGEWPIPRNVYGDVIKYIEEQKPQAIIFDMMFIKSLKSSPEADEYLTEMMNKYPNIYTGMNFDKREPEVRKPVDLPQRLEVNINNSSDVKIKSYENCRTLMQSLMDSNVNIGLTNAERQRDGITRTVPPILSYKGKFYPSLMFKAASDVLIPDNNNQYYISSDRILKAGNTKLHLLKTGDVILNWYSDFQEYPFYKLINEMENSKYVPKYDFKNKVVVVGVTADAMYDIKSVPVSKEYPGVLVQATVYNNMLDNNFIQKTELLQNMLILICVIGIVGGIVMLSTSTLFAFLSTSLFAIAYLFVSYYVMAYKNIWIPVILPVIAIIAAFTLSILAKYLMKSRDFEYQYKLATIDGLTELYNHRYFQDALRKQIDISRRYEQKFSLIICDIDFFKKFNDTYGHQAGDAVLRQVAQMLKKNSRTTDYVCRYGGEEMSIILPNTNAEEALMLAERICTAIAEKPFHLTPVDTAPVTISLGVSTFPDNAQTPQDLIEWADKGLYYAKEHGRNQVGRY